jgi:O-antigen/teichoic acid export membrane protein
MGILNRTALVIKRIPGGLHLVSTASRLGSSSFLKNLGGVSGALIINRLLGLVTLGYVARVLGPENYGVLGFSTSVTAYAGILLMPGMMIWGTRAVARDHATAGQTLVIVNITRILLSLIAYIVLSFFAFYFVENTLERMAILVAGLALFQASLSVDWVLNGLELMRIPAGLGVMNGLIYIAALFTLIHSPDDILTLLLITPTIGVIQTGVSFAILLKKVKLGMPTRQEYRQALRASLPLGLMAALVIILHYANNLMVRAFLGVTTLGIFLAAYRLLEIGTMVPGVLANVFLPRLARFVKQNPEAAVREAKLFAQAHMMAAFFIASFLFIEASAIVNIIYGIQYSETILPLRFMAIALIFNFAIAGYTNCLISFGQDKVMIMVVVVSSVVSVGGGLLLIPRLGILGAAAVIAAIDLAGWLYSLRYYKRVVGELQLRVWIKPLLGAAAIIAASYLMQEAGFQVFVRVPLAMLIYLPFVISEMRGLLK